MGGGIIGLEMGTVYHALGSRLTWLKCSTRSSRQLIKTSLSLYQAYQQEIQPDAGNQSYRVEAKEDGIYVTMEGKKAPADRSVTTPCW